MRYSLISATLVGLAASQCMDAPTLNNLPGPVLVQAPLDNDMFVPPPAKRDGGGDGSICCMPGIPASCTPCPSGSWPIWPPGTRPPRIQRTRSLQTRDGDCMPRPVGAGPVPSPDTVAAFWNSDVLQAMSKNAQTPDGYDRVLVNGGNTLFASKYIELKTLDSYNVSRCASNCDNLSSCMSFNIYIERDPSLDINEIDCPSPPSTINYKCSLWGTPVTDGEAMGRGRQTAGFEITFIGSNVYTKNTPPTTIDRYEGPTILGGAISLPSDANNPEMYPSSYMGFQFFPFSQSQGFDPQTCANACDMVTANSSKNPSSDGTYQTCLFFNAYVLTKGLMPQGLYCSLYNQTWEATYGTALGLKVDEDIYYTVSHSSSYSLSHPPNPSTSIPRGCQPGPIIKDSGFETGEMPPTSWNITKALGSTTYSNSKPGSTNEGGTYAFAVDLAPNSTSNGMSGVILSQTLNTCHGTNYSITMDFRYDDRADGNCFITLAYPYHEQYAKVSSWSGSEGTEPATWITTGATFQASSISNDFAIFLRCKNGASNKYSIDNVRINPTNGRAD